MSRAKEYLRQAAPHLNDPEYSLNMLAWQRACAAGVDYEHDDAPRLSGGNVDELERIIAEAPADPVAWHACSLLVQDINRLERPLPGPLSAFVSGVIDGSVTPKKQSGPKVHQRFLRDRLIQGAVYMEAREHGTEIEAACHSVSAYLVDLGIPMGSDRVAGIWKARPTDPKLNPQG